ncbi:enolase C-terminal domain-like protein [Actinomadura alba]|uniref:Mandelate racemase n=1 Tax=Actinomadura alba TaxID=406431 RepID=A0ABR7M0B4_9ACTN|nr:enolase C-terminal domain-like protein [Actinomadura alba]MBC6470170.1 mandelate racemase [Actinomadura alba]
MNTGERIDDVGAAAYTVPSEDPAADGTFTRSETTLVLARAHAGDVTGIGWTYGPSATATLITHQLAPVVRGRPMLDVPGCHEAMCRAVRDAGRVGMCSLAISALDCALWDLKARSLDLPLHHLLGVVRAEVPVYGSGAFTTLGDDRLRRRLEHWAHDLRIPRVKIEIGEGRGANEERDLARLRLAREIVGAGVELYADANGAYSVKQAIRVARAAEDLDLRWLEEPVPADDLPGLRAVARAVAPEVAAGEYGFDLPYFARMIGNVDCLQADVTRCGGITEFQRVAALARARGRELSGHRAPHLHAAVMSSTPVTRHIEWFHDHVRIEERLFDGTLSSAGGTVRPRDDAPGLGVTLKYPDAEPYRVR